MTDLFLKFRDEARRLDRDDPLGPFRWRFYTRPGTVYLDGNSLGLLSRDSAASLRKVLKSWETLGIRGWLEADPPWFTLAERLGARCAALVGAEPDEVVLPGTTTVNIHALVDAFFPPRRAPDEIVADALDFPTDIYALKARSSCGGSIRPTISSSSRARTA